MKYIDSEKLIAEIKRRKDEWQALINKNNAVNPTAVKEVICEDLNILDIITSLQQEQPEYGYLSTEYIHGKKPRWNVGDVLAYYMCTSNEEGEYVIGKVSNVEFDDEEGWLYTFEDEYVDDEQSLDEEGVYKKNR